MPDKAASKFAALAGVQLAAAQKAAAVSASEQALANSQAVKIRFLAARVLIEAGARREGRALSTASPPNCRRSPRPMPQILEG